jgi:DNA modification methylase
MKVQILHGDNRQRLKEFPDNHFDSCVCDPPYELGFMGKAWDKSGIAYDVAMWKEVYRVMKPGAHLLAFGGSRTYHRLACAIEDAGFQIRDQIMWLYGSGFPKSLDVGKAIDKAAGAKRTEKVWIDKYHDGGNRQTQEKGSTQISFGCDANFNLKELPVTPLARQWDGWGTALKPAHEPIVMARKPLEGTVVANILKHGTGAINVAGCRIEGSVVSNPLVRNAPGFRSDGLVQGETRQGVVSTGRWPANVIHDGSPEVLASFPDSKGQQGDVRGTEQSHTGGEGTACYGEYGRVPAGKRGDNGSAARFFYCAKASQEERNRGLETRKASQRDESRKEGNPGGDNPRNGGVKPVKNNHPTVKPLSLMAYLVRLVTPPGGLGLDIFCGSGSTLIAFALEGFNVVGIDLEAENCELAQRRCRGHLGMLAEVVNQ